MAVINQVRLSGEKLVVAEPTVIQDRSNAGRKIRTETNSTFEFGVVSNGEVKKFQVKIKYVAKLSLENDDVYLGTYESETEATFDIQSKGGIDDWMKVPLDVLKPYFAFVHYLARQQAQDRLLAAGFRGVVLPIPDNVKVTENKAPEKSIKTPKRVQNAEKAK